MRVLQHIAWTGRTWSSLRQGDGHAAGLAPGDDGDLMHRVLGGQLVDDHGVARLVIGGETAARDR